MQLRTTIVDVEYLIQKPGHYKEKRITKLTNIEESWRQQTATMSKRH